MGYLSYLSNIEQARKVRLHYLATHGIANDELKRIVTTLPVTEDVEKQTMIEMAEKYGITGLVHESDVITPEKEEKTKEENQISEFVAETTEMVKKYYEKTDENMNININLVDEEDDFDIWGNKLIKTNSVPIKMDVDIIPQKKYDIIPPIIISVNKFHTFDRYNKEYSKLKEQNIELPFLSLDKIPLTPFNIQNVIDIEDKENREINTNEKNYENNMKIFEDILKSNFDEDKTEMNEDLLRKLQIEMSQLDKNDKFYDDLSSEE